MTRIKRVLFGIMCFLMLIVGLAGCESDPIEMPQVTGLVYTEAEAILDDLGLTKVETIKENGDSAWVIDKDNWIVLSQDPSAGTEVSKSTEIVLTVKKYSEIEAEAQAAEAEARAAEEANAQAAIDSLVGASYLTAHEKLSELGYTITWKHAATNQDFTETLKLDIADPNSEFALPWIVTGITGLDTSSKTVTLLIDTQENLDSQAAASATEAALSEKLDVFYAWEAVKAYGDFEYPYGFKLHNWIGVLAETAEDENTWFLKATCDVTNAFGATAKDMVCEARVTGTSENPQVVYFVVY